jgi:hypothetical protein
LVLGLLVLVTRRRPASVDHRTRPLTHLPGWLPRIVGLAGLTLFLVITVLGLATGWLVEWRALDAWAIVGMVYALAGDVVAMSIPWRRLTSDMSRRRKRRSDPGRWPAIIGLSAFGLTQLAAPPHWQSAVTGAFLVVYAAAQILGARRHGEVVWSKRGDGLALVPAAFARLAPLTVSRGWLVARRPLSGFELGTESPSIAPALLVTIAIAACAAGPRDASRPELSYALVNAASLALAGVTAFAIHQFARWGARRVAPARLSPRIDHVLTGALVPIACAYLVTQLAGGWHLQTAVLVAGHFAALSIAHDRAFATLRETRIAVRTAYWALGMIVASLCLGLWLTWEAH